MAVAAAVLTSLMNPNDLKDEEESVIIKSYFLHGFTYTEILAFLHYYHNINIGYRQLQRKLRAIGLKRRQNDINVRNDVFNAILLELDGGGRNFGYRSMHLRLSQKYHLNTSQSCVREILKEIDPEGVQSRRQRRLHRRQYNVPGPNFLWHIDGWDKLKRYGLCVHGCIDGYSRRVMWLEASATNNNPYVICHYFTNCVRKMKGLPSKIRADRGTENVNIEVMQTFLRSMNQENIPSVTFLYGRSTANQRVECWWSKFPMYGMQVWVNHFKTLESAGIIDTSNNMHIQCIFFCYISLFHDELKAIAKLWNAHYIRGSRNSSQPNGRPDSMYFLPELFGGVNSMYPVYLQYLDAMSEYLTESPPYCQEPYNELFDLILHEDHKNLPENLESAQCTC